MDIDYYYYYVELLEIYNKGWRFNLSRTPFTENA